MLDVTTNTYRSKYIKSLIHNNPQLLCKDFRIALSELSELDTCTDIFEESIKEYSNKILQKSGLTQLASFEELSIIKALNALDLPDSELISTKLTINPHAKIVKAQYIYKVQDGKKMVGCRHPDIEYVLIPKVLITDTVRVDEYPILGTLKVLKILMNTSNYFSLDQINGLLNHPSSKFIIEQFRKMILYQLLVVKD